MNLKVADRFEGLVREALQWDVHCWNSIFDGAEEMDIDFCFYISPFQMMKMDLAIWR
jgi:hypothetical protein